MPELNNNHSAFSALLLYKVLYKAQAVQSEQVFLEELYPCLFMLQKVVQKLTQTAALEHMGGKSLRSSSISVVSNQV